MSDPNTWPFQGRLRRAPETNSITKSIAKTKATVIFVHHFKGSRSTTHWHQNLMLEMGYDSFAFNLRSDQGLTTWVQQIQTVVEQIPGPKIFFSFSFPSAAVAMWLAKHPKAEVFAWICDGGPFAQLWRCVGRYFLYAEPIANPTLRRLAAFYFYFRLGGPVYGRRLSQWRRQRRQDLPILSLRAGADLLVPEEAIQDFFANHPVQTHVFEDAGHLQGLQTHPQVYKRILQEFLAGVLS